MKKLKIILQSRYLLKAVAFLFILYSILSFYKIPNSSHYSEKNTSITGIITHYEIDGNQMTIYLKAKEKVMVYYYFKTKKEKEYYQKRLELGMKLTITGEFKKPSRNTIPNGFNYQKYLLIHHIFYTVTADAITITQNNDSVLYAIKNTILKRIDKIDKTGYFRTFLLGDKTLMKDSTLKVYQSNGVSHLFSISGMHVSLIVGVLLFFLNKISYSKFYKYSLIIPVLLFYLFLTDFSASITRTVIMYILFSINECLNLKIKKLDIMLLVLIVAILVNHFIIFDIGFQYSYTISLTIITLNKKINQAKNKLIQSLIVSFICFLISFPICIYYFYQVNIISIIFNLIMIPIVSTIIFPLTLITFFLPIMYPLYEVLITILEKLNQLVGLITITKVIFSKPPVLMILLYYFLIILSLWKKKYFLILGTLIFIHKCYPYWNSVLSITTLDIGQGDSIFIKFPNNQGNILIDTGGKLKEEEAWRQKEQESSLAINKIIPYVKSLGISKIDYLFLTHGDYDHMGEAINLVTHFKVGKVILNCGEFNDLENKLIKVLEKKNINYYSCIKELNIDKYKLYFLNNKDYGNENDNSSVIYTELNNHKFLFMGDAGVEVEEDLIKKYNLKDIDVLKVGHHGSKTSSSKKFIDQISPKYSIISVGNNNRYGHPNKEILNILDNSKIYRTDQDGSIMFKIKNNKLKINTCPP